MLLRPATPEDSIAVAQVHVRAWQAAYRGLLPAEYLDRLRPEDRAKHYDFRTTDPRKPSTTVAVENGAIVGFATVVPARDPDVPGSGELSALYVDPASWGRAFGRALIDHARCTLSNLGFRDAVLWVLSDNLRAQRFYNRDGWLPDGLRRTASVWGIDAAEVRYHRRLTR